MLAMHEVEAPRSRRMGAPNLDGEGSKQNGVHQVATRLGANQDTSLPFAGSNVPEYIELLDGSGNVTQTLRLIVNQVGTVQAIVDTATGEVVQRLEHDEFGRVLFDSNPGLQPFGFAGGLVDPDTGLVRFGARDYEPATGRWTARDPVRFAGGAFNVWLYSDADPVSLRDPSGLSDLACFACMLALWSCKPTDVRCVAAASLCVADSCMPDPGPIPPHPGGAEGACGAGPTHSGGGGAEG